MTNHDKVAEKLTLDLIQALRHVEVKCLYTPSNDCYIICFEVRLSDGEVSNCPDFVVLRKHDFVVSAPNPKSSSENIRVGDKYSDKAIEFIFTSTVEVVTSWVERNFRVSLIEEASA